jgi:hypothetical protein
LLRLAICASAGLACVEGLVNAMPMAFGENDVAVEGPHAQRRGNPSDG